MKFIVMELGSVEILRHIKNDWANTSWIGNLFTNDRDPCDTDVRTDYDTSDAVSQIDYFGEGYNEPELDNEGSGMLVYENLRWSVSGLTDPLTFYGWIVYDTDDRLIFAIKFDDPVVVDPPSGEVVIAIHRFKCHS